MMQASMAKPNKKRVRFSPDVIVEYSPTTSCFYQAATMQECTETQQIQIYEDNFSFTEDNTDLMSIYDDFYDSYQFISEYGDVVPHYMTHNMDLMGDSEIEIDVDMKSISIDTVSTSCDDFDISMPTISHPMRSNAFYSPDVITGLTLKKKFKMDIFFKSRNFWCDPIGRTINWSRSSGAASYKSFRLCGGFVKNRAGEDEDNNRSTVLGTAETYTDKQVKCMGCIVACRQQSDTLLSFSTDSAHELLLKFPRADSALDWYHLIRSLLLDVEDA